MFAVRTLLKPRRKCDVCGAGRFWPLSILQCIYCRFKCHKRCLVEAIEGRRGEEQNQRVDARDEKDARDEGDARDEEEDWSPEAMLERTWPGPSIEYFADDCRCSEEGEPARWTIVREPQRETVEFNDHGGVRVARFETLRRPAELDLWRLYWQSTAGGSPPPPLEEVSVRVRLADGRVVSYTLYAYHEPDGKYHAVTGAVGLSVARGPDPAPEDDRRGSDLFSDDGDGSLYRRESDLTSESPESDLTSEDSPSCLHRESDLTRSSEDDVTEMGDGDADRRESDLTSGSRASDLTSESSESDLTSESSESDLTSESSESDLTSEDGEDGSSSYLHRESDLTRSSEDDVGHREPTIEADDGDVDRRGPDLTSEDGDGVPHHRGMTQEMATMWVEANLNRQEWVTATRTPAGQDRSRSMWPGSSVPYSFENGEGPRRTGVESPPR